MPLIEVNFSLNNRAANVDASWSRTFQLWHELALHRVPHSSRLRRADRLTFTILKYASERLHWIMRCSGFIERVTARSGDQKALRKLGCLP